MKKITSHIKTISIFTISTVIIALSLYGMYKVGALVLGAPERLPFIFYAAVCIFEGFLISLFFAIIIVVIIIIYQQIYDYLND